MRNKMKNKLEKRVKNNKFYTVIFIALISMMTVLFSDNSFASTASVSTDSIKDILSRETVANYSDLTKDEQCRLEKHFTKQVIERVNFCEKDEECIIKDFGCPFGCGTPVNKNERIDVADSTIAAYVAKCGHCEYKCNKETRIPKCIFGRCSFED